MKGPAAVADFALRRARPGDIPALEAIIAASARSLSVGYYSPVEVEAAIAHVFGVDSELVADGTYFVAEATASKGHFLGCGGWSKRATLFGGDGFSGRQSGLLDPAADAAKIRAFFVAPHAARMGLGAVLLGACEKAAAKAGFTRTELMATLPGQPFYHAHGYREGDAITVDCGGTPVKFVQMAKSITS